VRFTLYRRAIVNTNDPTSDLRRTTDRRFELVEIFRPLIPPPSVGMYLAYVCDRVETRDDRRNNILIRSHDVLSPNLRVFHQRSPHRLRPRLQR